MFDNMEEVVLDRVQCAKEDIQYIADFYPESGPSIEFIQVYLEEVLKKLGLEK